MGADYVVAGTKTSIDAMGGRAAFKNFGTGQEFFRSILHHVRKSVDYVAIDLKGASKDQAKAVKNYVNTLTEEQRKKIIYVQ